MRLGGKPALIPGASRNIGRAIALAFATEGADLVLNTRANRDELEGVASECRKAGVRAVPVLADVADATAVDSMVGQGLAELGAIDVLVCNAAIRPHKPVTETSLDDWHRVLAVNLHSAFYLARAVVPAMKGAEAGQHHRDRRAVEPDRAAGHGGGHPRPGPGAPPGCRRPPPAPAIRHPRPHGRARLHEHRAAPRRAGPGIP